jgi:glycerol-3-phosphate acyltransferase PlsY
MLSLEVIAILLVGYLLGSIPFAVIFAKQRGIDVYSVGSGNPGATNVTRHVGKWIGRSVFVLDFLKGLLATQWFRWDFLVEEPYKNPEFLGMFGMIAAVVGHSYPVFSRFRGGKGVATTMGALIAVMQIPMIVGLLVWAGLFFSLRYVSLASIGFGLSLPVTVFFEELFRDGDGHYVKVAFAGGLAFWILFRHRGNVLRLLEGSEDRFSSTPDKMDNKESTSVIRPQ